MNSQLLEKFYKKECTPEEVKEVLRWFEQEEPGREESKAMHAVWQQAESTKEESAYAHDAEKIFTSILAKKNVSEPKNETPVVQLHPTPWKKYLSVAAALLLPILCIWVLVQQSRKGEAQELVTVMAQAGEMKSVTLADGSIVQLHANSSISYPKDFTGRREITLEGEAFFEVAHDKEHPFTVHTGKLSTQALGTSFNIRHLKEDSTTRVALATGAVRVSQQGSKMVQQLTVLEPGQELVYNKRGATYQVADFDRESVLGWKGGVLYFKSASLAEVVQELERWYGVEVEVQGAEANSSKADWRYSGSYKQQPIETVLEGISFVKKLNYSMPDSGTVILSFTKASKP